MDFLARGERIPTPVICRVPRAFWAAVLIRSLLAVGGGGTLPKFYTGRFRPEVQPLTLLYTIFDRKGPLSFSVY